DGFQVADATTDLDRQVRVAFGNGGDRVAIDRLAFEGAVQIDQMQAAAAGLDPAGSHGHRVIGKHRGVVHQALAQAHTGAVFQINSGNNQHVLVLLPASIPGQKVLQQLQAIGVALFRVELGGEYVVLGQCGGKVHAVVA